MKMQDFHQTLTNTSFLEIKTDKYISMENYLGIKYGKILTNTLLIITTLNISMWNPYEYIFTTNTTLSKEST